MLCLNNDKFSYFPPSTIDEDLWNLMLAAGVKKKYLKGTMIYMQNQPVENIVCFNNGEISTVYIYPNGGERLYEEMRAPAIIGHEALFSDDITMFYPSIIARTDIESYTVPIDIVEGLMQKNKCLSISLYKCVRNSLVRLRRQTSGFFFNKTLLQRTALAVSLLNISEKDKYGFIGITHEKLANFMGITRANVTICLNQLTQLKYIEKKRGKIKILDLNALNEFINN